MVQINKFLILFVIFSLWNYCKGQNYIKEKPDYIRLCKYSDSNYASCLTESVQKGFNHIIPRGIPPDVPSIDPFNVQTLRVEPGGGTSAANFKADLKNIMMSGFKDIVFKESKLNLETLKWDTIFTVPKVQINSDYKFDGNLLLVPLRGEGKLDLHLEGLQVAVQTTSRPYKLDGFIFLDVINAEVKKIQISGLKVRLGNLFNGNKELEDATNAVLNEGWKDFYEVLQPSIKQTIGETMLGVFKPFMKHIPMNFFIEDVDEYIKV